LRAGRRALPVYLRFVLSVTSTGEPRGRPRLLNWESFWVPSSSVREAGTPFASGTSAARHDVSASAAAASPQQAQPRAYVRGRECIERSSIPSTETTGPFATTDME
jgi:hypothetical protein